MELDMKNRFIQKEFGFCTVFAIANMFNNENVARQANRSEYKGCDDDHCYRLLQFVHEDYAWSDVLNIRDSYRIALPKQLVWDVLTFQNPMDTDPNYDTVPYLVTVRRVETHEFHHSVTIFSKRGIIYLSDPYKEEIIKCDSADELYSNFIDVWRIERPYSILNDNFLLMNPDHLGIRLY